MPAVFADSYYFFALLNRNKPANATAVTFSRTYNGRLVTTAFVFIEFADGCAASLHRRAIAAQAADELRNNPRIVLHGSTVSSGMESLPTAA